jgi:hypothetical protein
MPGPNRHETPSPSRNIGRRRDDQATFALTVDEQLRVNAVLQDWLGEQDPD